MRRQADSAHIRFTVAFWRGNDGRIQATLVERSDCTDGEELGRHAVPEPAALRALLAHHLATCAVARERIASALAGFEAAYALLRTWADEAEAATRAEAAAIAAYGAENEFGQRRRAGLTRAPAGSQLFGRNAATCCSAP